MITSLLNDESKNTDESSTEPLSGEIVKPKHSELVSQIISDDSVNVFFSDSCNNNIQQVFFSSTIKKIILTEGEGDALANERSKVRYRHCSKLFYKTSSTQSEWNTYIFLDNGLKQERVLHNKKLYPILLKCLYTMKMNEKAIFMIPQKVCAEIDNTIFMSESKENISLSSCFQYLYCQYFEITYLDYKPMPTSFSEKLLEISQNRQAANDMYRQAIQMKIQKDERFKTQIKKALYKYKDTLFAMEEIRFEGPDEKKSYFEEKHKIQLNMAKVNVELQEFQKCMQICERVLHFSPNHHEALYLIARSCLEMKDTEKGLLFIEKALFNIQQHKIQSKGQSSKEEDLEKNMKIVQQRLERLKKDQYQQEMKKQSKTKMFGDLYRDTMEDNFEEYHSFDEEEILFDKDLQMERTPLIFFNDGQIVYTLCHILLENSNLLEKERTFINQSLQEKYENERHQLQLIEQERYEKFKQEQPHEFSKHVELVRAILQDQLEHNRVKINVGGQTFMTTLRTINKRENLMKVMMTSEFMIEKDENGAILFADRNPFYFNMILEFLRTGSTTHIGLWKADSEVSMKHLVQLFEESNYFGCAKLSEAIQNRLKNCSLFREDEDDDACITHSFLENHIRVEEDVEPAKSEKIISFNVRGQLLYPIAIEKLVKHSESLFPSLLKETNENTIFLDRDPLVYHIIFDFLETGRFDEICKQDQQVKTQIKKEAKELNLLELLEYWNILRYHIEHLGYSNRRMKEEEDLLRRLFVSDRDHEILQNPYLHLLNVFDANQEAFMMKNPPKGIGLLFDFENPMEASKFKVSKPSIPHLCPDFETFQIQFDTLTCGIFDGMNWENVFCAGGCVLRAILATPFANSSNNPITDSDDELDDGDVSEATMDELEFYSNDFNRKKHDQHSATCFDENFQKKLISYYNKHERWSNTDIDLFLYGLTECEAEQKLVDIYKHFKKRLRAFKKATNQPKAFTDIMLIRTSHALTFRFYEPVRTVQVILRIYNSPSEILMGFDIPSCCFGYDGSNVYCLPRAKESLVTRTNIVDPDRQSTTYESRLVKYALRGFRIGIPNYQPAKVKANNFVDDECRRNGLAKILWLQNRYSFTLSHPGILTSAFDISSPSPNHDYCIVKIPKDLISPYWLHSRIKSQYTYAVEELNQHPFFDFTLNDINGILNLASNRSTLSAKIEWITLEPTRQYIGSFNPTDRNFFKDAYQTKQFKYIWEFKEGKKIFTPFNISESISLERHYRLNRSSFEIGTNNRVDFEDMVQIINEDTPEEIRRKVRRKKKVCSPLQKGED